MKVLIACHKAVDGQELRGGETSVGIIAQYLQSEGFSVMATHRPAEYTEAIKHADVVMTWGRAADQTAAHCRMHGKPLILMVRFWKNVAPRNALGGFGDLMKRTIHKEFKDQKQHIFDTATAIITNTQYAAEVIEHHYGRKAIVSYVPVMGDVKPKPYGKALTIITPEIYGELELVASLAPKMPDYEFKIVNCTASTAGRFESIGENVNAFGYMDIEMVFDDTRILLLPIYENDICGTRRVTIEGFRHAVPVIANDRCGVSEKIPKKMLLPRLANSVSWIHKIHEIEENYQIYQALAANTFRDYNTPEQLAIFKREILKAVEA